MILAVVFVLLTGWWSLRKGDLADIICHRVHDKTVKMVKIGVQFQSFAKN